MVGSVSTKTPLSQAFSVENPGEEVGLTGMESHSRTIRGVCPHASCLTECTRAYRVFPRRNHSTMATHVHDMSEVQN